MNWTADQRDGVLAEAERRRVLVQVDLWRQQLINLARSNRLLYFRHTRTVDRRDRRRTGEDGRRRRRSSCWKNVAILFPPEDETPGEDDVLNTSTSGVGSAPRLPSNELLTTKKTARELQNALRGLDRRLPRSSWIRVSGSCTWQRECSGGPIPTREKAESPLVLVPVKLHRGSPREPYALSRADDEVVLNPALAVKLESSASSSQGLTRTTSTSARHSTPSRGRLPASEAGRSSAGS